MVVFFAFEVVRKEIGFSVRVVSRSVAKAFHEVGGSIEDFFRNGKVAKAFSVIKGAKVGVVSRAIFGAFS